MKKKIAIVLVGLMCVSSTGCSILGNKGGVDMTAVNAENMFTNISDDAVVEGSVASEAFSKAMSAIESDDNITIGVKNTIVMGTEGQPNYQNSSNESVVKLVKDGDVKKGSVVIDNVYKYAGETTTGEDSAKPTEEKSRVTGSYMGDALYFITNDGDKVKEEMGYEDFLSVVNTYSLSIYNDSINKAACVENKNGKTYYISYDPAKFETTMNTNMEASGQTMADGEAMHVKYANIIANINNDGDLIGYGFVINAEYVNDESTIPYNYSIETNFSDRGKTKIDEVKDTDSYMTAEEYTEKMQKAAAGASGENNAEESTENETNIEESTN